MITPNKTIALRNSALGLSGIILEQGPEPIHLAALYNSVLRKFETIDQFLLTIDLLFVLGRVNVNMQTGVVTYVD